MSLSPDAVGYVINNYSSCGQVQVKRFGYDDDIQDDTNCFWVHADQGTNNPGVAGVGEHPSGLQPGSRVQLTAYGPHSYVAGGTFGRMGSGSGGGGGGSADSSTAYTDVNVAQSDWVIPTQNPGQQNGIRAQAKAPDGRYNSYADGQPYDFTQNQYPSTSFKDA